MFERSNIVQGRGRSLIFHYGWRKDGCFCRIVPTPHPKIESQIKDLLPFLYAWIRSEVRNQNALLSKTTGCESKEVLARAIIEYHFRAVESLRHPKNGSPDPFENTFEAKLREEIISLSRTEDELIEFNTTCVKAIPWNYFHPAFLHQSPEELKVIQDSIIQTHSGELFPFTMERKTA